MHPFINLLHLKYFCDAALHKSVSEAAKINFVTQSTVSQAIVKLETIIGAPLLVHRQKFQMTEEGEIVFDQSRHIFKSVQEMFNKVNQNRQEIAGTVQFVSTHSLTLSYISEIYQKARINIPTIDIKFKTGGLSFIRNALKRGEAEFGIVVYDHHFEPFEKFPMKKGQFNLYQAENAPSDLIRKGVLVDYLEGMHVDHLGSLFTIQTELSGWESVARFTETHMGVGFLPDYMVGNRYPSLKILPKKIPKLEYEICAVYNKESRLSRAASAFLDQFF